MSLLLLCQLGSRHKTKLYGTIWLVTNLWLVLHWFHIESFCTFKSFSEDLIFASVNPQYDKRLFLEFQKKILVDNMLCTNIVLTFKNKKQFLHNMILE